MRSDSCVTTDHLRSSGEDGRTSGCSEGGSSPVEDVDFYLKAVPDIKAVVCNQGVVCPPGANIQCLEDILACHT